MVRLLVIALILAEIASLILVGQALGVLPALLLVVLAALAGAAILRRQGGDAVRGMRGAMRRGRDPRPALLRGGFRVAAALLLIVPGFLGDAVALLLLLPPVQGALAASLARRGLAVVRTGPADPGARSFGAGEFGAGEFGGGVGAGGRGTDRPGSAAAAPEPVEEAEWEELAPGKRPTHRPSGWTRH